MQIGKIVLRHGLCLAPMAGVTDYTMRTLAREAGAEMVTTEMLSSKAIRYGDEKTAQLAKSDDAQRPLAIQIFGNEPDVMAQSAAILCERFSPNAIDINMGCPVRKVTGNGEGSALMTKPELAADIVKAVCRAVEVPVTVKIRAGWDNKHKIAAEFARKMEQAGAAAIAVHARTKEQLYTPGIDLDIIKAVKETVSVPVIGNGDIYTVEDAIKMYEYTKCDGVMIARGAYGNPWIFDEIKCALEGRAYHAPSTSQRLATAKRHQRMLIEDKGEYIGLREARKQLAWYIKGLDGAASARARINSAQNEAEVIAILDSLENKNDA